MAKTTSTPIFNIQTTAIRASNLTSVQLEQWFASIEKANKPSKKSNAELSTRFLTYFGLQSAEDVLRFLQSPAGQSTMTMIGEEIVKIESLKEDNNRQHQTEALKLQRRMLFILVGMIYAREAHTKHINELIQLQIDKKIQDNKKAIEEGYKTPSQLSQEARDQMLKHYEHVIKAVETQMTEARQELNQLAKETMINNKQIQQATVRQNQVQTQLTQLNPYLHLPVANQAANAAPAVSPIVAFANAQATNLATQIEALKNQPKQTKPGISTFNELKYKMLEEELAFHHKLINEPSLSHEEIIEQGINHRQNYLSQFQSHLPQYKEEEAHPFENEIETIHMSVRQLNHLLQFHKGQRIILDRELKPVQHPSQTEAFIYVDPTQANYFHKVGADYVLLEPGQNLHEMNAMDLVKAIKNFQVAIPEIQETSTYYRHRSQEEMKGFNQKAQRLQSRRVALENKLDMLEDVNNTLLKAQNELKTLNKTPAANPFSNIPVPAPGKTLTLKRGEQARTTKVIQTQSNSYSQIMRSLESLIPAQAPAPSPRDISKAERDLLTKASISPEKQNALKQLVREIKPHQLMEPGQRTAWFEKARRIIPDLPSIKEFDSSENKVPSETKKSRG